MRISGKKMTMCWKWYWNFKKITILFSDLFSFMKRPIYISSILISYFLTFKISLLFFFSISISIYCYFTSSVNCLQFCKFSTKSGVLKIRLVDITHIHAVSEKFSAILVINLMRAWKSDITDILQWFA